LGLGRLSGTVARDPISPGRRAYRRAQGGPGPPKRGEYA